MSEQTHSDLPAPITPSARKMMLALEQESLQGVSWSVLARRLRPMNPESLPAVADQLVERGWVEIAGMEPTRHIRLTSAGMNALAVKAVTL